MVSRWYIGNSHRGQVRERWKPQIMLWITSSRLSNWKDGNFFLILKMMMVFSALSNQSLFCFWGGCVFVCVCVLLCLWAWNSCRLSWGDTVAVKCSYFVVFVVLQTSVLNYKLILPPPGLPVICVWVCSLSLWFPSGHGREKIHSTQHCALRSKGMITQKPETPLSSCRGRTEETLTCCEDIGWGSGQSFASA